MTGNFNSIYSIDSATYGEGKNMTKNNPHHSYCSNSIKDIEVLALSDFEYFHVADKIETFEPFVVPLVFVALYCCSNDEKQDECENKGSKI